MVSPISVHIEARPSLRVQPSPLSILLVVGHTDTVPTTDVTLGAPASQVTEITEANATTMLGAVPSSDPGTQTPLGRAAYDLVEAGSAAHVYVLPFPVSSSDNAAARAAKVASALTGALRSSVERSKFPDSGLDMIVLPRETAVAAPGAMVAALKQVAASGSLECVALCDAGDAQAAVGARPSATNPTQASVASWAGANGGIEIYAASNRGDVANYDGMWGSVIMAAHHARWASLEGVGSSPYDLSHPLAGASNLTPARELDLTDGSSAAVVLDRDDEISSLTTYEGGHYVWGGLSASTVEDPRQSIANHIVANRSLRIARDQAAQIVRRRATGDVIQGLRLRIEEAISRAFVPRFAAEVQVDTPTIAGGVLTVPYEMRYDDYIHTVALQAEVYI